MSTIDPDALDAFHEDIQTVVETLKDSFEADAAQAKVDDHNNLLYIEIEGLQDYTDEEIEEIAGPILEELDLDFEEILLVPLSL
jgi:ATP-dependent 26S proteasome regulatory subunit